MKNLKELNAILTAIHCLNFISDHRDMEIMQLTDYAFRRIFGCNGNFKTAICLGHSKETVKEVIMKLLKEDTQYLEYKKEYGHGKK